MPINRQAIFGYITWLAIIALLITMIVYIVKITGLGSKECSRMNSLYPTIDGNIRAINSADSDCSGNLYDYYVKTAYNACSGGAYKNDVVNTCNLKAVLKQGVRAVDFEVYSVKDEPVVATSTNDDYFVKETFNYVPFADVMNVLANYAFSSGTCPNPTDPLLLHLRIKSMNPAIYNKMAAIFETHDPIMLGKDYSFENDGQNLGATKLLDLSGRIVLIVDRINNAFLDNEAFLEYVNLTSNSNFMRAYTYNDVKNNPDADELTNYNKTSMTIVFPDTGANPSNPSGLLCRGLGCQLVAMRFQQTDANLTENNDFFDSSTYAFVLKPANLRNIPTTIPDPTPQNPDLSYAPRTVSSNYYNFKI